MVDYSKWEEKHVQVTSLLLDAENPRIPPTPKPMEQRELIAELVQHDKVVELARDIANDGYSPVESLIGCYVARPMAVKRAARCTGLAVAGRLETGSLQTGWQ